MKLLLPTLVSILHLSTVKSIALERRDDPHDRGTWYLNCQKAPGACNNACYSIICLQQDTKTMYYDSNNNNDANRKASGCNAPNSVCNAMPFSQKLNDPQQLSSPSCDEWPMAEVSQSKNTANNVLRCITQPENSSGGSQLLQFIEGNGDQPGRKGDGDFVDGDYWQVEFQHADDNDNGSPFCLADAGACSNDGYQFYLSKALGNLSPEYDYDHNNRYALSAPYDKADIDIVQCRVHLTRKETGSDDVRGGSTLTINYEAEVFDFRANSQGKGNMDLPTQGDPLVVGDGDLQVKIWAGDSEFSLDDVPNYSGGGITWTDDKKGYGGAYCSVGGVDGDTGTRDEDCYFPCYYNDE